MIEKDLVPVNAGMTTNNNNNAVDVRNQSQRNMPQRASDYTFSPVVADVYCYIVANAERDESSRSVLLDFIHSQGYNTPSARQTPKLLAEIIRRKGKDGIYELAKLHPDRKIIINQYLLEQGLVKNGSNSGIFKNATGGDSDSGKKLINANTLIISGVFLSAVAITALFLTNKG